jgi:FlgD Ig-like domain
MQHFFGRFPHLSGVLALVLISVIGPRAHAAVTPLKPHGQLVAEVMAFLESDIGTGGIRNFDNDPQSPSAPPYFYHYSIRHDDGLWSSTGGYPGYASISYPGYTASIAIDAFLDWWVYSGDPQGLQRAEEMAQWLLERRTPATDLYGNWVYSTQTDGVMGGGYDGEAVMSDKSGMFGLRCLRLYDITGNALYLQTATEMADTYVATQMTGPVEDAGRWPFRVRPSDGLVTQDYTSHLIPVARLLDEMAGRTGTPSYSMAAQATWSWLENNPMNPASTYYMRWEGFYEDIGPESAGFGDHYSAEATASALIERNAPGDIEMAISIRDTTTARFMSGTDFQNGWGAYFPALLEWKQWMNTTYAATGQWAVLQLQLAEATQGTAFYDSTWATLGRQALHNLTYGQAPASSVPSDDGRMLTTIRELSHPRFGLDTWYEQNFNTVLYMLEAVGYAPDLAPNDENHILRVEGSSPTSVGYGPTRIETQWSGPAVVTLKLAQAPSGVRIGGEWLAEDLIGSYGSWSFDAGTQLCVVDHDGSEVIVQLGGVTDAPAAATSRLARLLPNRPNPFNPRTEIRFVLERETQPRLELFDVAGRRIREWPVTSYEAGTHAVVFDGFDDGGRELASGVYLVRLQALGATETRRITLVR